MLRKNLINRSKVDWGDHTGRYPILYNTNIYYGCDHNCPYCYSRKMTYWKKVWTDVDPVENAVALAQKEAGKPPGRIMFCSMTDPYQALERKTRLARGVLEVLLDSPHLILVLTKSDLVTRDFDLMQGHDNVELGVTITALQDLTDWEPRAPGNRRRIEAVKMAHDFHIKTFASVEPWIPDVTNPTAILSELKPWVDRFVIGTLNYAGVDHEYYRQRMPSLLDYVKQNQLRVMWKKELKPYVPLEYSRDSINRYWVRCPHCGRKTPAWTSQGGKEQRGRCRWCKESWGGSE